MEIIQSIQNRIYEVRGHRVMLDRDLAGLYETETKRITEAVKRNSRRFPADFMFRLTLMEWRTLRSQFATSNAETTSGIESPSDLKGGTRYLPYAFTEHGVAMLSGVLNSDKAIQMNLAIIRSFIEMRNLTIANTDWKEQLRELKDRIGEHDAQLNQIYDALENLLDEKAAERKWDDRQRIGFRQ
jgi:phage regulator Rha-like protein